MCLPRAGRPDARGSYLRCVWQLHDRPVDTYCVRIDVGASLQNPPFGQQVFELPAVTTIELRTGLGSKVLLNIQGIVAHFS